MSKIYEFPFELEQKIRHREKDIKGAVRAMEISSYGITVVIHYGSKDDSKVYRDKSSAFEEIKHTTTRFAGQAG